MTSSYATNRAEESPARLIPGDWVFHAATWMKYVDRQAKADGAWVLRLVDRHGIGHVLHVPAGRTVRRWWQP